MTKYKWLCKKPLSLLNTNDHNLALLIVNYLFILLKFNQVQILQSGLKDMESIRYLFYFQHNYFYLLNIKEYGRVLGVETESGGRLDSAVAGSSGMCSVGGEGDRKVEYSEGSLEQHSVNTSRNISTLTRGVIAIQNGPLFTCWAAGRR